MGHDSLFRPFDHAVDVYFSRFESPVLRQVLRIPVTRLLFAHLSNDTRCTSILQSYCDCWRLGVEQPSFPPSLRCLLFYLIFKPPIEAPDEENDRSNPGNKNNDDSNHDSDPGEALSEVTFWRRPVPKIAWSGYSECGLPLMGEN